MQSICQQIWKSSQWPQVWEMSVSFPTSKKGNTKEYSDYRTTVLIAHVIRLCSKCFKLGFSIMLTKNFQMYKLKRQRNQRSNCQHSLHNKARGLQKKHLLLLYWLHKRLLPCGLQQTMENSLRDGKTRPPYLSPEKPECKSRSNS